MTVSVFDHPILSGLLGEEKLAPLFTARAEIDALLRFEAALAEAEAEEGVIPQKAAQAIASVLAGFHPDVAALKTGTARDGVMVPALLAQLREKLAAVHRPCLHFGATSQDAIDTGLALRLNAAMQQLGARLDQLVEALEALERRDGGLEVMAHTRMQAAIVVPAGRKIRAWREPLARHRIRLETVAQSVAILSFGGAAGTLDKLGEKAPSVAARLADKLGLRLVAHARHSERDAAGDFAALLSLITGSLGKMGQDIALMAQSEVDTLRLAGAGGSSAMAHKKNPVKAEALVALARFNATILSGMHQALVHENERSGAAWTLEWMLLPQMVMAAGAALRLAGEAVEGMSFVARKE